MTNTPAMRQETALANAPRHTIGELLEQAAMEQPMLRAATVQDFRSNLEHMRFPKGTGSLDDYERGMRLLSTWLRHLGLYGITPPACEACIKILADWVGV